MDKAEVISRLKAVSLSPTEQRIAIYRFLDGHRIHPTAETVWRSLVHDFPTLSRTTVHNTLNLFAEKGLLDTLSIEKGEQRFDIRTDFHAHFKCMECGNILDVELSPCSQTPARCAGRVLHTEIHYYGICPHCENAAGPAENS